MSSNRKTIAIVIVVAVLAFCLFFFSPRQQFKRAIDQGNLGTAARLYSQMSDSDKEWAEEYTMEAVGNVLGNLF